MELPVNFESSNLSRETLSTSTKIVRNRCKSRPFIHMCIYIYL